ncbi:hypothetical protein Scel_61960 [Streptomyces cellostaticus]|nr:hypothetical protein Scel_61960 [Streptomyces cellostaticus]
MSTAQEPTGSFIASTSGGSPAPGNFTLRMPLVAQRAYTRPESVLMTCSTDPRMPGSTRLPIRPFHPFIGATCGGYAIRV